MPLLERRLAGTSSLILALLVLSCTGGESRKAPEPSPTPIALAAPETPSPAPPSPGASIRRASPSPPARATTTSTPPPTLSGPDPTPVPAAAPSVDLARLASLVGDGEAALTGGRLDEATARFDEALALDPDNPGARMGKARAATTALGLKRTFVPDLSSADGAGGRVKEIEDFEVDDLDVRRAARVPGATEIEALPVRIKPGDAYEVRIYLRNQSRKKKRVIKISDLVVRRILNGRGERLPLSPMVQEVKVKERALVATLTGPWEADVASWVLEVQVLAEGGDVYQNRLVWK